ncbi:MAG: hypothetical protein FJ098_14300, partial [Deltaproteobacteria bacterium]|nr:hypothetical protein [Deltaproteobacteria bacterium]
MVGTMHRFFLLSLALGLSSGCGGGEPQDLLDTAGGLDAVSDSRAGDIPGDLPPADSVPGPGDPCE